MKISFSSDTGKVSKQDIEETSRMSEEYFKMENDSSQAPASQENKEWVHKNSNYLNIIRENDSIIGYVFMLPCTKSLMEDFLAEKIDEATLFAKIRLIKFKDFPEAIYLCSAIVQEKFRLRYPRGHL